MTQVFVLHMGLASHLMYVSVMQHGVVHLVQRHVVMVSLRMIQTCAMDVVHVLHRMFAVDVLIIGVVLHVNWQHVMV